MDAAHTKLDLDVLIFGGGCAGLWLVDELRRRGLRVLLLESGRLGSGQTASAQGILHGGLKYSLGGILSPAARMVRDMPERWAACLAGRAEPDLSAVRLRSSMGCYLWRGESLASWAAMLGAVAGLTVKPVPIDDGCRPAPLKGCPGTVYRLDEPVIDTISFLGVMARRNRGVIWKIEAGDGLKFERSAGGAGVGVTLRHPRTGLAVGLNPARVVLTAGEGNALLRELLGLATAAAQLRPLHVALLRGELPPLAGHSVAGTSTRVTITSDVDARGRTVWQLGGKLSEDGVALDGPTFLRHAREELAVVLPGWQSGPVEWASYRVNRAERATRTGAMPGDVQIVREGPVWTVWPTKLVLAPRLTDCLADELDVDPTPRTPLAGLADRKEAHATPWQAELAAFDWPTADVADAPWNRELTWISDV